MIKGVCAGSVCVFAVLLCGCVEDAQKDDAMDMQGVLDSLQVAYPVLTRHSVCELVDEGDVVRLTCDAKRVVSRSDDVIAMERSYWRWRGDDENETIEYPNISPIPKPAGVVVYDEIELLHELTCGKKSRRRSNYKALPVEDYAMLQEPSIETCASLADEYDRQNCVTCLAKKSGDVSYCQRLADGLGDGRGSAFARDRCLMDVALDAEDPAICTGIDSPRISECLIVVAEVVGGAPACELIENDTYRRSCEQKTAGYGSRRRG